MNSNLQQMVEDKLFKKISEFSTNHILQLWNHTEKMMMSIDLAEVRGAMMRVLEARHNKEFNAWIDAEYPNDDINVHFKEVAQ